MVNKKAKKLTYDDIGNIFELVEYRDKLKAELKPLTNESIAKKFDVSVSVIEKIVTNKIWKII